MWQSYTSGIVHQIISSIPLAAHIVPPVPVSFTVKPPELLWLVHEPEPHKIGATVRSGRELHGLILEVLR